MQKPKNYHTSLALVSSYGAEGLFGLRIMDPGVAAIFAFYCIMLPFSNTSVPYIILIS